MGQPNGETRHPLRCTCPTSPILAFYGKNTKGRAYIHVASFKNQRPLSQIYTTAPVSVWCRVCGQWWNITVRNSELTMEERLSSPPVPYQKNKTRVLLDNPTDVQ